MNIALSPTPQVQLLSGVATKNPLSGLVHGLKNDSQSHHDFNIALRTALQKNKLEDTKKLLHDPENTDFRIELESTQNFLERRFNYISQHNHDKLIENRVNNDTASNAINSAWSQLMRSFQSLVGDNLEKLQQVLALPAPKAATS